MPHDPSDLPHSTLHLPGVEKLTLEPPQRAGGAA